MGDKTQLATVALGARYDRLAWVVLGTTLGMMIANVPAVIVGEALAHRIPMKMVRWMAAALFVAAGLATLAGLGTDPTQPPPPRARSQALRAVPIPAARDVKRMSWWS